MRLALIVNRSAGTFRRLPLEATTAAIAERLRAAGHAVEVTVVGRRDLPACLSHAAGRDDLDAVIAGGGDGTILTAILAGLGGDKPLGVLPLGTLNLLARDLGLDDDPLAAAAQLATAGIREIDLAEVNGHPFAIWASLGMHPWIVRRRDKLQRKGRSKWRAFALAALRALRRYPMVEVTLTVGGDTTTITTPLLVISNNVWQEQTLPLSRPTLDKGVLEVHVAKCTSRLGVVRLAFHALVGHWRAPALLQTFLADEVRVTSRRRRSIISLDGEVTVMRSPLLFHLRPRALRILAPDRSETV